MNIHKVSIERADRGDVIGILVLQKQAFHSEAQLHNNYDIPQLKQTLESIRDDSAIYTFFKAVEGNSLVVAVKTKLLSGHTLWIGRLIVKPGRQGQGIGTLIRSYIEGAFDTSIEYELFTGVSAN